MTNRKIAKKGDRNIRAAAAGNDNTPVLSSRLVADLKSKGIPAFRQMTEDEQKQVWNWTKEVVQQYRKVLDAKPGNIRNIEDLPFPKEDIKMAIKISLPLYISKNMQSTVRVLKTAYKELGTFQSIDPKFENQVASLRNGLSKVNSKRHRDVFRTYDKYLELIVIEKKALLQEINSFIMTLESLTGT